MPEVEEADEVFQPDTEGTLEVNVPAAGDVRILDAMYDQWVDHGARVARAQFPALRHQVRYRSPVATAPDDSGTVAAWLRLATPISGRRITPITTLFKQAVLSRHQESMGSLHHCCTGTGSKAMGTNWLVSWPARRGIQAVPRPHPWLGALASARLRHRDASAAFAMQPTRYGA